MRAEEKIADVEDERELAEEPAERLEEDGEREVEPDPREALVPRVERYFDVVGVIEALFRGDDLDDIERPAGLDDAEVRALLFLRDAIRGHRADSGRLVLAEDRLQMLGQALAVLQPALAVGLDTSIPAAQDLFHHLADQLDELRHSLSSLEDAQEEMFEQDRPHVEAAPPPPPTEEEKKAAEPEAEAEVELERPSTLSGRPDEPAVERVERPSTLSGEPDTP